MKISEKFDLNQANPKQTRMVLDWLQDWCKEWSLNLVFIVMIVKLQNKENGQNVNELYLFDIYPL